MVNLKTRIESASGSIGSKSLISNFRQRIGAVLGAVATIVVLGASGSSLAQVPFTEDFSTTTLRDDGQTTANWDTATMQLLLPSSAALTGTFDDLTTVEAIAGSFTTRSVVLADLDGDGDLDLIDGANGRIGVQLNDGNGTFGNRVYTSPVTSNTRSVEAADMDHDGDIDFVVANNAGPIRLYVNDGTGRSFSVQPISSSNSATNDIALVDINGDGLLDVVSANIANQRDQYFLNTGDPQVAFGPGGQAGVNLRNSVRESSRQVTTGDIDNDGDLDIVFATEDLPNRVYLNQLAQGSPLSFSTFVIEITAPDDTGFSMDAELGDLNGDGFLDLVVVNYFDSESSKIYFNDALGTVNANPFTIAAVEFTSPSDPMFAKAASLADADNDGDLDIFLVSSSVGFRNRVYTNDGAGAITGFVDVGPVNQQPLADPGDIAAVAAHAAVGDIDGDGDIDWIVGNQESLAFSGPMQNIILRNTGAATGAAFIQLSAHATSLPVDTSGITSVRLNPSPATSMVGLEFHNSIDYWVSGNDGLNWSRINPDGRPVSILAGTNTRWRADLRSMSMLSASGLALLQLDIAENASGPQLGAAIVSADVTEGDNVTGLPIAADFTDADGDTIYYSVSGLPDGTGLVIDPLTGEISGTPTNEDAQASVITVTVTASDGSLTATDVFALTVINDNNGPNFTSTEVTAGTQDVLYSYAITAEDPDLDAITFSAPTAPSWLGLVDNGDGTATLSGTPTLTDIGDHTVKLEVTDGDLTDVQNFTISVANVNDAPVFTSMPITAATEGADYSYTITVVDPDLDGVTITAPTLPTWLMFTDNGDGTATLTGTPTGAEVGDHTVDLQAQEDAAAGLTTDQSFVVTVAASADGPVITLTGAASITLTVGNAYSDQGATASDPQDGDLTDQIVTDNPVNTNIATTYTVTYTVEDSAGNMAQAQRTVIVRAASTPPPSGGGGSAGLVELLIFAVFTLACGAIRRRRPGLMGNRAV